MYSSHGWLGGALERVGVQAAFSRLGVVIALTFVGLPFVVRTVQPVLEDFDVEQEEAAATHEVLSARIGEPQGRPQPSPSR